MTVADVPLLAEGGWSPLQFDPGIMVWTFVVFSVVVLILAKFAWRPLLGQLALREQKVKQGLEEAEQARAEAARIAADFQRQVKEARAAAGKIADEARASAERLAQEIETRARAEAEKLVTRAREEISLARRQALEDVRTLAVDLAIEAAGAVLKKSVDAEDNRRLAAGVIKMLKREELAS